MLYRNATLSETRAAAQESDRSRGTAEDQNWLICASSP
jgi:hypothetical protein